MVIGLPVIVIAVALEVMSTDVTVPVPPVLVAPLKIQLEPSE